MKKKLVLPMLLASSLLALTSCNLFTDDDLSYTNTYNPPNTTTSVDENAIHAGGVDGTLSTDLPGTYVFKNICYAKDETIKNNYGPDKKYELEFEVNNGEDYYGNKAKNNYDLYVPDSVARKSDHTVILFIHGGAWVSGFKTDVNEYVYEFAKRDCITATIKYTLLKKTMDDPSLSIFRNLDEIDACIASIKEVLTELGFDSTKTNLVIGGFSSGSHLGMLYTYSRGNDSPIPLKFVVNAVGPVDIKEDCWKRFLDPAAALDGTDGTDALDEDVIATQTSNMGELQIAGDEHFWNRYQTLRIANGMCGLPSSLDDIQALTTDEETITDESAPAAQKMLKAGGGEDLLSVTHYINATNDFPMICAYAGQDQIVGINQFATLEHALKGVVNYRRFYFRDSGHTDITKENYPEQYEAFCAQVEAWCKAPTV